MRTDSEIEAVRMAIAQACPPKARERLPNGNLSAMAHGAIRALDQDGRDPAPVEPVTGEMAALRSMAEGRDWR